MKLNCSNVRKKKKTLMVNCALKDEIALQECFVINNAWLSIFGERKPLQTHQRHQTLFSFHAEGQQSSMDVPTVLYSYFTEGSKHTQKKKEITFKLFSSA